MTWVIIIASLAIGIAVFVWRAKEAERRFWNVVRSNPDASWGRFVSSAECLVDEVPTPGKYAGPYKFETTDGISHSVFIWNELIADTYVRIARHLIDDDASPQVRQAMRDTYNDDPRGAGAVTFHDTMRQFE